MTEVEILETIDAHESALMEPLSEEQKTRTVKTDRLEKLSIFTQKHEQVTLQNVLLHDLADQIRELFKAAAHVHVLGVDKHAVPGPQPDAQAPIPRTSTMSSATLSPWIVNPPGRFTIDPLTSFPI